MPYVERMIISGDLLEVERYYVTSTGRRAPRRTDRTESTPEQTERNNRYAGKRLVRLLNANFSARRDLFLTLTHGDSPDEVTAKNRLDKLLKAVRKYCTAHRSELKYIRIDEQQGAWHHHMAISAIPLEVLEELWPHGRFMVSPLNKSENYRDLVAYLLRDTKASRKNPETENAKQPRRKYARRWSCSRNLVQPTVATKEIKRLSLLRQLPKAPKGYILLPDWYLGSDIMGNLYQSFSCVRIADARTLSGGGKQVDPAGKQVARR